MLRNQWFRPSKIRYPQWFEILGPNDLKVFFPLEHIHIYPLLCSGHTLKYFTCPNSFNLYDNVMK